ncbi:MAG: hypothetical protein LBC17_00465 [Lactobacillaceae bacterium]|jgi:hypothetical protein|nr:hypothetical protein [Lactobacillaceae bacterium]
MDKYKIISSIHIFQMPNGNLHISLPLEKNVEIGVNDKDLFIAVLTIFKIPITQDEMIQKLLEQSIELDDPKEFIELLLTNNIIKKYIDIAKIETSLTTKQLSKYDRQIQNFCNFTG